MASNTKDKEREAYFSRFMAGELEREETVKVMMNPLVHNDRGDQL